MVLWQRPRGKNKIRGDLEVSDIPYFRVVAKKWSEKVCVSMVYVFVSPYFFGPLRAMNVNSLQDFAFR